MNTTLEIILPVFGLALLGYGSGKGGILDANARAGLNSFVFKVAIPIMLFRSIGRLELPELRYGSMIAYYLSGIILFLVTTHVARRFQKQGPGEACTLGMSAAFANTVLLALPIIIKRYGEEGAWPLMLIISCHTTVLFGFGTVYVEVIQAKKETHPMKTLQTIATGLFTNPIILGLLLGVAWNLCGFEMPVLMSDLTGMISQAAVPCALFSVGLSLCDFKLKGNIGFTVQTIVLKLLVHPALMYGLAQLFQLNQHETAVAVITASMPTGISAYLFATGVNAREDTAAASVLATTALGVITVSIVMTLVS